MRRFLPETLDAVWRSRAPLRLGFGGGGTDIPVYSTQYGGCVLNATISMYAYSSVAPAKPGRVGIRLPVTGHIEEYDLDEMLQIRPSGPTTLVLGILQRFHREFGRLPGMEVSAWSDAPAGSGLGASSTLAVAVCTALAESLQIPMGEYDIARMAYEIERVELSMAGGQQDQYAAAFGGINFMEFHKDGSVLVNPLRVRDAILSELESSLVLYFTGISRESARIIDDQVATVSSGAGKSMEAMHRLKDEAVSMKAYLLRGEIPLFYQAINQGWMAKKETSGSISNPKIEMLFAEAMAAGAVSAKLSGAGGGGFVMFFTQPEKRSRVVARLSELGGQVYPVSFTHTGAHHWSVKI
jgi:D-glycero-alpha-D-manno-heptose-7-phosphate kinase